MRTAHSCPPEQFLLTTLVVKLAVMAAWRRCWCGYRRFRHILISERRAWPDRLMFALGLGVPLTLGVASRLLLQLRRGGPDAGRRVPGRAHRRSVYRAPSSALLVGLPALIAGEWGALPFAVGCGFAGGGLRELCPKEEIWHFSPFVFTRAATAASGGCRDASGRLAGHPVPRAGRAGAAAAGDRLALRPAPAVLPAQRAVSVARSSLRLLATVLCVATPIKIWNNARIEHRLQEQEKLLLAAQVEALASQINPHFLFNTLTSISSLIRSQPETARMVVVKLSGLLRRLLRSRIISSRCARSSRRSTNTSTSR